MLIIFIFLQRFPKPGSSFSSSFRRKTEPEEAESVPDTEAEIDQDTEVDIDQENEFEDEF